MAFILPESRYGGPGRDEAFSGGNVDTPHGEAAAHADAPFEPSISKRWNARVIEPSKPEVSKRLPAS
ncbi:MAG: hypothetical protein HOH61_12100 [Rhodospirillaceae bacterium]|nr:hypothetical protein [Rhodospirillaceae bacterium]